MKKILFLVLINLACLFSLNAQIPHQENCATCKQVIVKGGNGQNRCQHDGKHPKCGECGKIIDKGHVVVNRCQYDGTHPPYLNVDTKEIIVNGKKWEKTITVSSNVKWSAEASHSWISISKQNGSLAYTLHRNPQNTTREGYIDIYTTDRSKSVRIRVVQLKNMGIEVKSIQFAHGKDSLLTKYGDTLYASDVCFLCAHMSYRSLMTELVTNDTLFVKIIKPDGTLSSSKNSPTGYTYRVDDVYFQDQDISNTIFNKGCFLSSWGSKSGGSYSPGTYTYEIWYHDGLVYSTKFTLYDKKATTGGVRMDGNTLVFSVDGTEYRYEMVYVSGGTFKMGAQNDDPSSDNYDPDANDDESPVRRVTVGSFYIGQTEVTQALWKAVMGNNPSKWKGDNLPVENVSYNDCKEFILKLNQLTGRTFRLPTEKEWEYSARGGYKSNGYKYAGCDKLEELKLYAWYPDNSNGKTHPVAQKKANELGLYDMSGNVLELCDSHWYNYIDSRFPVMSSYIVRGGCFYCRSQNSRVSARLTAEPNFVANNLGFRLVMSAQ